MTQTQHVPETLIPHTNHAAAHLGSVLVLGLGKSGKSAAAYCADLLGTRVDSLAIAAGTSSPAAEAFAQQMRDKGARVEFDHEDIQGSYDLCIASPGISQFSPFYLSAQAACTEVVSEVEFAWRESQKGSTWIAVTGTNGKTTTTSLIAHLLKEAGFNAEAVGNIGDVCLDAVAKGTVSVYVAEVSSYQLASTRLFAPQVSVILNVTPDHLSWHKGFDEYRRAKMKVLDNLPTVERGLAVLDATDDEVRAEVRRLKALGSSERGFAYIPVGTKAGVRESMIARCGADNAAYLDGTTLTVCFEGRQVSLVPFEDMQIRGDHNASNALAAASAALWVGASEEDVRRGLLSFRPLAHRMEPCGTVCGKLCYNDSKGTNVDATLKAVNSMEDGRYVLMLGGCDKGTDLSDLVQAAQGARAVICFGDAGPRFADAFEEDGHVPVVRSGKLEQALDDALAAAHPGDAVVLSPACASFDEFSCYQERGDSFKKLVEDRRSQLGA